MGLTAVIMAGGKGRRMKTSEEKPLIQLAGKPMIAHVIEALEGLEEVERIVIATSDNTPKTAEMAKQLSMEVFNTSGVGYVSDMQETIKKLGNCTALVVPADLPLITTQILKEIIARFRRSSKPALSVMVSHKILRDLNLIPNDRPKMYDQEVSPVGINMIESKTIDKPQIEQENAIFSKPELALNVNSRERLRLANKMMSNISLNVRD